MTLDVPGATNGTARAMPDEIAWNNLEMANEKTSPILSNAGILVNPQ